MKKVRLYGIPLLAIAVILVMTMGIAGAREGSKSSSKDMGKLNAEISMLNSYKSLPGGKKVISKQLSETFDLSSSKIDSLLSRTPKVGDAAATLAFAEKLDGGVNDANIKKVESAKSKGGWDQVAANLQVDLNDVADKLSSLDDDIHKNIKQALSDSYTGRATGGTGDDSETKEGSKDE